MMFLSARIGAREGVRKPTPFVASLLTPLARRLAFGYATFPFAVSA